MYHHWNVDFHLFENIWKYTSMVQWKWILLKSILPLQWDSVLWKVSLHLKEDIQFIRYFVWTNTGRNIARNDAQLSSAKIVALQVFVNDAFAANDIKLSSMDLLLIFSCHGSSMITHHLFSCFQCFVFQIVMFLTL